MRDEDALDAMVEAGTALLGIPAAPEWRAAIRLHLRISLAHGANVTGFPLPDGLDPAPVFRA